MFNTIAELIPVPAAVIAAPSAGATHGLRGIEAFVAGHPSPNQASVDAAERALTLARRSRSEEGLLVLLSGGASAMLASPAAGVTLEDKVATARSLMAAGAAIHELNCVRKHLSRIKGGHLAAAAGRTTTFALSDVHGPVADDPSVIGSGPTVADETTYGDALEVIEKRHAPVPQSVLMHLQRGARGGAAETIKPGDRAIASSRYTVIGNRHTAVDGAARAAEQCGYPVLRLLPATAGEARDAARQLVRQIRQAGAGLPHPTCVIASGETTVTVHGDGLGGRNQELALAAAAELASFARPVVLGSAGTDGVDGPTDAAGAIVDNTTLERAKRAGLDWESALARNDAYHFFDALGDLIRWGPTGTNVGDLHVLLLG